MASLMSRADTTLDRHNMEIPVKQTSPLKVGLAAFIVGTAVLASAGASGEEVNKYDGQWHYGFTIYGWLPAMTTDLNFGLPNGATASPSVTVKPSNYLSDLRFAAMALGSARKGNWELFTDIVYADIGGLSSKVRTLHTPGGEIHPQIDINVDVDMKSTIWTLGAGYTAARSDQGNLDIIAGARYLSVESSLGVNAFGPDGIFGRSVSTTEKMNIWTGIIGVTGALRLSDDGKWYMPYEADVGAGSSSVTAFNGILGVGYKFGWGDVVVAWRYLDYKMGSNDPIQKLIMSGPAIGARFSWQ
jgi:hypothetical protein